VKAFLIRIGASERGATAIEYGLIAALMVVVSMGAMGSFGDTAIDIWNDVSSDVSDASQNNS
jgi:pilus assembly protein Flp/PilA